MIRGATPLAAARHIFLQRVTERNFCLCRHRPHVQGQNDFVYIKPDGKYKVNYQLFGSYISKFSHLIMETLNIRNGCDIQTKKSYHPKTQNETLISSGLIYREKMAASMIKHFSKGNILILLLFVFV